MKVFENGHNDSSFIENTLPGQIRLLKTLSEVSVSLLYVINANDFRDSIFT